MPFAGLAPPSVLFGLLPLGHDPSSSPWWGPGGAHRPCRVRTSSFGAPAATRLADAVATEPSQKAWNLASTSPHGTGNHCNHVTAGPGQAGHNVASKNYNILVQCLSEVDLKSIG